MTVHSIPNEPQPRAAPAREPEACAPDRVRAERTPEGRVFLCGGMSAAQALQAVQAHRSAMAGRDGQIVKRDVKTNVTFIEWDGSLGADRLCVKEFVRAGSHRLLPRWIRHRPAIVSWRGASRLAALGIGVPDTLGLVIGKGASSYVIMRALEGFKSLAQYVRGALGPATPTERRRDFLRAGADFLGRCYSLRVFHTDLKAGNLFVRELESGGWEFSLLDLAAVRFPRRIRLEQKLLNLAQLNSSVPLEVAWTDRMRFLRHLAECEPSLADRSVVAEIARLTRSRRCVWSR
ncbi:MAG: lipopolysaccharide kinase InaA family protein [Candidatus Brocadiia bacterium]